MCLTRFVPLLWKINQSCKNNHICGSHSHQWDSCFLCLQKSHISCSQTSSLTFIWLFRKEQNCLWLSWEAFPSLILVFIIWRRQESSLWLYNFPGYPYLLPSISRKVGILLAHLSHLYSVRTYTDVGKVQISAAGNGLSGLAKDRCWKRQEILIFIKKKSLDYCLFICSNPMSWICLDMFKLQSFTCACVYTFIHMCICEASSCTNLFCKLVSTIKLKKKKGSNYFLLLFFVILQLRQKTLQNSA